MINFTRSLPLKSLRSCSRRQTCRCRQCGAGVWAQALGLLSLHANTTCRRHQQALLGLWMHPSGSDGAHDGAFNGTFLDLWDMKEKVHTTQHNTQDKFIPHKRVKSVSLLSTQLHHSQGEEVIHTLWRNQKRLPEGAEICRILEKQLCARYFWRGRSLRQRSKLWDDDSLGVCGEGRSVWIITAAFVEYPLCVCWCFMSMILSPGCTLERPMKACAWCILIWMLGPFFLKTFI